MRQERRWLSQRFDNEQEEPLGPLANLLDLMLVFACGLIAAMIGMSGQIEDHFKEPSQQIIQKGAELPAMPDLGNSGGQGYESVGQVYRDPATGKLILIGQ